MHTNFSHNLKNKRLSFGWSQERVACEISIAHANRIHEPYSIDKTTYRAWESGRSTPKMEMLITLVEVFKIDDLYLFILKAEG